jgi:hypothetical protein
MQGNIRRNSGKNGLEVAEMEYADRGLRELYNLCVFRLRFFLGTSTVFLVFFDYFEAFPRHIPLPSYVRRTRRTGNRPLRLSMKTPFLL